MKAAPEGQAEVDGYINQNKLEWLNVYFTDGRLTRHQPEGV
jgi:hypothetical protein